MKHDLELLKADVAYELEKISSLEAEWREALARVNLEAAEIPNYDRGALGYLLHNLYNGCETIFRSIARFFENDLGTDSWHSDLLKRMRLSVPGYRPALLDEELYRALDDLRAFRHKFRHSYGFELDWAREKVVASRFLNTAAAVRSQVSEFLRALDELHEAGS